MPPDVKPLTNEHLIDILCLIQEHCGACLTSGQEPNLVMILHLTEGALVIARAKGGPT